MKLKKEFFLDSHKHMVQKNVDYIISFRRDFLSNAVQYIIYSYWESPADYESRAKSRRHVYGRFECLHRKVTKLRG